eukprot:s642_g7.t1
MAPKKRKAADGHKAGAPAKRGKDREEDGDNLPVPARAKGKAKAKPKAEPGTGQEQVVEKASDDSGKEKKKKEDPPIVCQPVTRDAFNKLFKGTEPLVPSVDAPDLAQQVEPPVGCEQITPSSTTQTDARASETPKATPPFAVEMKLGSLVTFAKSLSSDCEQGDSEQRSWMREKLQKAEPHEFQALLKESMDHPLLDQHKNEIYAREGLTTDDWRYGDEAGDTLEDLVTFALWLAAKPALSVNFGFFVAQRRQQKEHVAFVVLKEQEAARKLFCWDQEENMSKIVQKAASWSGLGEFSVATACSGTGSFEICFAEALRAFLREFAGPEGKDAQVKVPFAVEITPFKQKFLACVVKGPKIIKSRKTALQGSVCQLRESNLDQCLKILENPSPELTYKARPFLVNSLWFGLPQNRERVYICAVQTSSDKLAVSPQTFLDEVEANLKKLYKTPPAAASLLLPDDDPAVVAELERCSSTVQGSILMAMLAALALSTDSEEEETKGIGDLLSRLGQIADGDTVAATK